MFKRIVTAALVFGMAATAPPVNAQVFCDDRASIAERLTTDFNEVPHGIGLKSPKEIIEIWVSPETRTWTLLLSRAEGQSCVIASGVHWMNVPEPRSDALAQSQAEPDRSVK